MAEINDSAIQLNGLLVGLIEKTSEVQTTVLLLRDDYKGFSTRLLKVEETVSSMKTKDGIHDNKIETLEEKIDSMEKKIDALQSKVIYLMAIVGIGSSIGTGLVIKLLIPLFGG